MRINLPAVGNSVRLACVTLVVLAALLPSGNSFAEEPLPVTTLPGDPVTPAVRNLQRKADRAFARGDYERAYRVYLKQLAPKGDKHAHSMIGQHYEYGLGVPADPARALAWYALSAERGSDAARSLAARLSEQLAEPERARADELFAELQERYGDRRLLVQAVRRDQRELRKRTGSYLGGGASPLYLLTGNGRVFGDQYYEALEARIDFRTLLLGGNVTLGELEVIDAPTEGAQVPVEPEDREPEGSGDPAPATSADPVRATPEDLPPGETKAEHNKR